MWFFLIIGIATASPENRVTRMIEDGHHEDAIWIAEGWLERHEGHANEQLVTKALIDAWVTKATQEKDIAMFRALRERFDDHPEIKRVHQKEALVAWEIVSERTSTRLDVETWIQDYSHVIKKPESMTLVADRAYREAKALDSAGAWSLFIKDFSYDDLIPQASEREERAAYREMRDDGSVEAYQRLLEKYPDHLHRDLVARDILKKWSVLDIPCEGEPPRCTQLPAGSQIAARWDDIPNRTVHARLVARLGTLVEHLDPSYLELVQTTPGLFSLVLASELPTEWTQFYAVELPVEQGKPFLLPFEVQNLPL